MCHKYCASFITCSLMLQLIIGCSKIKKCSLCLCPPDILLLIPVEALTLILNAKNQRTGRTQCVKQFTRIRVNLDPVLYVLLCEDLTVIDSYRIHCLNGEPIYVHTLILCAAMFLCLSYFNPHHIPSPEVVLANSHKQRLPLATCNNS